MGNYSEKLRNRLPEKPQPGSLETEEKPLPIKIDFWFSQHATADDARRMQGQFDQADVFVPETFGHTPARIAAYQAVSDGTMEPNDRAKLQGANMNTDPYTLAELQMLANTKKLVLAIDLPSNEEMESQNSLNEYAIYYALGAVLSGQLQSGINLTGKVFRDHVLMQNQRELFMVQELKRQLGDVKFKQWCKDRLTETGKADIQVLVQLGAVHTRVAHQIAAQNLYSVERHMPEHPFIFPPADEEYRQLIFGKKHALDETMIQRMLTQYFTAMYLSIVFPKSERQRLDPNGVGQSTIEQRLAKATTRSDMEKFSANCATIRPPFDPAAFAESKSIILEQRLEVTQFFNEILAPHGLALPHDEASWRKLATVL